MSLTINRQVFSAALRDVLPATVGRATLAILSNVLLTNNGSELTLIGTNLEYAICITIECNECIDVPDLVIEAKLLQAWLANQTAELVTLTPHGDHVILQAGKSKTKIKVLAAEEYPDVANHSGNELTVDPFDFGNALAQAQHACSQQASETRQYTRGVFIEIKKHRIKLTGMNGIYMIHRELATQYAESVDIGIMPQRCIGALTKILQSAEDDAKIVFNPNTNLSVAFHTKTYKNVYFTTQLIESKYPNYERIVPTSYDLCMVLGKEDVVRAINNCMLFATDDVNRVYWETDTFGLFLRAVSAERGEHEDYLTAISVTGDLGNNFILNGRYVLDWLRTVNTDNIQMECRNGLDKFVIFKDADAPDMGYGVFPPMILKGE